jgi:uncharacterized membrane protein HdeD (DUF308 family)
MATKTAYAADVATFPWWIILVEGIFALIFGLFLLTAPAATSVFAVTVLGFYWLIRGIFAIVEIFLPDRSIHWGWLLFMGILGILAGMAVLGHPLYATALVGTALIIFLAFDGIIMGIVGVVRAFMGAGWGTGILGVLSVIIGTFLLANVWVATLALPIVLGVCMLIGGIVAIVYAFRVRQA